MDEPLFSVRYADDACPLIILPDELLPFWQGSGPLQEPATALNLAGTDYERAFSANWMVDVLPVGPGHGIVLGAQTDACGMRWLLLPDASGPFALIPWYGPADADLLVPRLLAETVDIQWKPVCDTFEVCSETLSMFLSVETGDGVIVRHPFYKSVPDDSDYMAMDTIQCPIRPGTYTVAYSELRSDPTSTEPDVIVVRFRPQAAALDGRDLMARALTLNGLEPPPAYNIVDGLVDLLQEHCLTSKQDVDVAAAMDWLTSRLADLFPGADSPVLIGAYAHGTVIDASEAMDILFPADVLVAASGRLRADSSALVRTVGDQLAAALPTLTVRVDTASIRVGRDRYLLNVTPCFVGGRDGYQTPDGAGGWLWRNPTRHTSILAAADRQERGALKPLIRLLKLWNGANGTMLGGFHLALMAEAHARDCCQRGASMSIWAMPPFVGNAGTLEVGHVPWVLVFAGAIQDLAAYLQLPFPDPWQSGVTVGLPVPRDPRSRAGASSRPRPSDP